MSRSRNRRKTIPNRTKTAWKRDIPTNRKNTRLLYKSERFKPESVLKRDNILKRTDNRVKRNDRIRLINLTNKKFYIKRNFLGLPVDVKRTNLTKIQAKKNEILYTFNPTPKRLIICARRAIRRAVLFARKGVGNGIKRRKKRYTEDSKVRC